MKFLWVVSGMISLREPRTDRLLVMTNVQDPRFARIMRIAVIVLFSLVASEALANTSKLRGTYGYWSVYCKNDVKISSDCALTQAVRDREKKTIAATMALSLDLFGGPELYLRVEPGHFRTEAIGFLLDGVQNLELNADECDSGGCSTSVALPKNLLDKMFVSKIAEVQYRFESYRGTSLEFDLEGLKSGFSAMSKILMPTFAMASAWSVKKFLERNNSSFFLVNLVNSSTLQSRGIVYTINGKFPQLCDVEESPSSVAASYTPVLAKLSLKEENGKLELASDQEETEKLKMIVDAGRNCGDKYSIVISGAGATGLQNGSNIWTREDQTGVVARHLVDSGLAERKILYDESGTNLPLRIGYLPWAK